MPTIRSCSGTILPSVRISNQPTPGSIVSQLLVSCLLREEAKQVASDAALSLEQRGHVAHDRQHALGTRERDVEPAILGIKPKTRRLTKGE
eukprot:1698883-Prymnesium_polylepis.1